MGNPKLYHFLLPGNQRPDDVDLVEPWYPGVKDFWPGCTTQRVVHPIDGIVAVVIHATAGSSSEGAVSVMKKPADAASFHWLVPDENESQHGQFVWACVPEALAAWHVRNTASHPSVNGGARRVNHWSLGIEIVNLQDKPGDDLFSDWQLEATAQIVRHCWAKYPNLKHVVSHAMLDPSRRSDPGDRFDWDRLQQLVLGGASPAAPPLVASAKPLAHLPVSPGAGCCTV